MRPSVGIPNAQALLNTPATLAGSRDQVSARSLAADVLRTTEEQNTETVESSEAPPHQLLQRRCLGRPRSAEYPPPHCLREPRPGTLTPLLRAGVTNEEVPVFFAVSSSVLIENARSSASAHGPAGPQKVSAPRTMRRSR